MPEIESLQEPVLSHARRDVATLAQDWSVGQALDAIRAQGLGDKLIYFYVVDREQKLVGVLPTRRLLTAPLAQPLHELVVRQVVAIPQSATLLDACEMFVLHKFLAFPIVDEQRRVVGIIDVNLFAEEVFDLAERERVDEVFEAIGFRVSQVREASPVMAFRFRFPWLLATIASGTLCALLAGAFEMTLAKSLVLAFFLTMVLGLAESVSIQSMTLAIQSLRAIQPTRNWYFQALRREIGTAAFLGLSCGFVVGLIVFLWRGNGLAAISIGGSLVLALCAACIFGLSVPTLLHALKLDPKIAAGPVTLAFTDIFTLLFYFSLAALIL